MADNPYLKYTAGGPLASPPRPAEDAPETWRVLTDEEAAAEGLPPGKVYKRSSRGDTTSIASRPQRDTETGIADVQAETLNVIRNAVKAKRLSREGWFATGFASGSPLGTMSGSSGADLETTLTTIGANTAFSRLQKMREESPTGGALGQVAVPELMMLRDSIASLSRSQSDEQFAESMDTVIAAYRRVYEKLGGDPNALQEALRTEDNEAPPTPNTQPSAGGPSSPIPGIREPTQQDVGATGAEGRMGFDKAPWELSVEEYLSRNYGVDPGEEVLIEAFWNANRGNQGLTVEGVNEWYRSHGIGLPEPSMLGPAIEAAKKGYRFEGAGTGEARQRYQNELDQVLEQRGADTGSVGSAIGVNAAEGVTLGALDEMAGAAGFVNAAVRGQNPLAGYTAERDLVRREQELAYEAHPVISTVSEIGGSLPTGGVGFTRAGRAGSLASQALRAGNRPRAFTLAGEAARSSVRPGATVGGLYGYNTGEGTVGSMMGAGTGAAAGAAVAPVAAFVGPYAAEGVSKVGGVINNLLPRPPVATAEQSALISAGGRQNVPVRRVDLQPDEMARQRGVARNSEEGNRIIREAENADIEAMERATERIAPGNAAPDSFALGERTQTALNRQGTRTQRAAQRFYDIATRASNGQTFTPKNAVQTLADEIVRLEGEGADKAIISFLREQGEKLSRPEGWTPMQFHAYRASLRKNIRAAGLPVDATELPVIRAIEAAGTDIEAALANTPRALEAVKRGDEIWRERAQYRAEVTNRLFGRDKSYSPDQTARALESMARSDHQRFAAFVNDLPPEERADLAATFVERLGRDGQGRFSIDRFLTQTQGRGALVSERSMRLLFGEDGMRAVRDLRALASAKQRAASETNYSKTGNVVSSGMRGLRALILSAIGAQTGGVAGAVVAPAASSWFSRLGERRAARLLTNPDVTKWLRTAPNTVDPRTVARHIARLDGLAARAPGMAMDIDAMKQAMLSAVNDNPARLAASEPGSANTPEQNGQ